MEIAIINSSNIGFFNNMSAEFLSNKNCTKENAILEPSLNDLSIVGYFLKTGATNHIQYGITKQLYIKIVNYCREIYDNETISTTFNSKEKLQMNVTIKRMILDNKKVLDNEIHKINEQLQKLINLRDLIDKP